MCVTGRRRAGPPQDARPPPPSRHRHGPPAGASARRAWRGHAAGRDPGCQARGSAGAAACHAARPSRPGQLRGFCCSPAWCAAGRRPERGYRPSPLYPHRAGGVPEGSTRPGAATRRARVRRFPSHGTGRCRVAGTAPLPGPFVRAAARVVPSAVRSREAVVIRYGRFPVCGLRAGQRRDAGSCQGRGVRGAGGRGPVRPLPWRARP